MRRWRLPLILSAAILLSQLFRTPALLDVVRDAAPADVTLVYPFFHAVFAPFTLLADYLNGGSLGDLKGFAVWSVVCYVLWRLAGSSRQVAKSPSPVARELRAAAVFLVAVAAFLWWGVRWGRPIPRLVASDSALVIFDVHSHTAMSHDGRRGFGAASNARWHERAGFDAAFVTDHNVFGAYREWEKDRNGHPPRLLAGEELSLNGLHMVVLGNDAAIANKPWDQTFDSSLALLRLLRDTGAASPRRPYVIASLPEYARNHLGADLGRVIEAGTEGLEIWTTSPKAMDALPPSRRREVINRARSLGIALFGATDMHGLGYGASVWNVARLPGWRALPDSSLGHALVAAVRADPRGASRVIARRRVFGETRLARAFAVPMGLLLTVRSVPAPHVVALLVWCWIPALLRARRREARPA